MKSFYHHKEYVEHFIPIYFFRSTAELSGPEGAEEVEASKGLANPHVSGCYKNPS